MATNNRWENFKLSNPVIGDRYNRTQATGWQQGNLAQAQKNFATDPWFSLGHTVGSTWADNYNDRGISKGRAEMQDALNGYLGQFGTQQQDSVNYNPNMIKGEDAGMGSKYITQADGTQPNGVLGQTSMYFDANGNFNTQQPDLAGGKLSYRYNKYLNSDNPDSEAMQNKGDIQSMNQMGNNIDFGKVDKEQAREYVRQQLESKGRTPYQIEQVLGQFDSIYDSKYGKWKEGKGTDFMTKGMEALKKGDYDGANNNFMAAYQYTPDQAKLGMTRANQMQAAALQRERLAAEMDYKNRLLDARTGGTLGRLGGGGRGTGSGSSSGGGAGGVLTDAVGRVGYRPGMSKDRQTMLINNLKLEKDQPGSFDAKDIQKWKRELANLDGSVGYSDDPQTASVNANKVFQALRAGADDGTAIRMIGEYGLLQSPTGRQALKELMPQWYNSNFGDGMMSATMYEPSDGYAKPEEKTLSPEERGAISREKHKNDWGGYNYWKNLEEESLKNRDDDAII